MPQNIEKIVVVWKKTALEELIERHNSRDQARFYVEARGASFLEFEAAHDEFQKSRRILEKSLETSLPPGVRTQWIQREFLPQFSFGARDLVVALGPDGLVVNIAKYLDGQTLVAFNPDETRIDGVLLPFPVWMAPHVTKNAALGRGQIAHLTMASAKLNDGQEILALNDLFIGRRGHASARYRLKIGEESENQSSSGIIVSTGAGSTGWLKSVLTGAARVMESFADAEEMNVLSQTALLRGQFAWDEERLQFSVREPFPSVSTGTELVFGRIEGAQKLEIASQMPSEGAIFSDGIEEDFLEFNAGAIAQIGVAQRKLCLMTGI